MIFCVVMIVKQMVYVDGTKSASKIVCQRRPPTKVWTAELLSEREADELCCGGFGREDLEEDFVKEEEDFIPTNLEVMCILYVV
uniref:Uncharacterized protein n=1 Tax=Tanacetum cinerariifolium TaxID=118510 RepID=A0A699WW60_TANCI|nr:hypothetical protein [Tanacetum cinerariifolium]